MRSLGSFAISIEPIGFDRKERRPSIFLSHGASKKRVSVYDVRSRFAHSTSISSAAFCSKNVDTYLLYCFLLEIVKASPIELSKSCSVARPEPRYVSLHSLRTPKPVHPFALKVISWLTLPPNVVSFLAHSVEDCIVYALNRQRADCCVDRRRVERFF